MDDRLWLESSNSSRVMRGCLDDLDVVVFVVFFVFFSDFTPRGFIGLSSSNARVS